MPPFTLNPEDAARFVDELRAIRRRLDESNGPEDTRHLRKIERWGRAASAIGYATAWLAVNPVACIGIALGISTRWMILAHHILHGGYDRIPQAPARYRSRTFAAGGRRWIDWCDWLEPRAWQREHNGLHHHRLGERFDPDVPERNFGLLQRLPLPRAIKYAIFVLVGLTWKYTYYGPNVLFQSGSRQAPPPYHLRLALSSLRVWSRCWLPYLAVRFGIFPLPFLILGAHAWHCVLLNTLFAELLTNFHSYLVIVTNHAGPDIPRFDSPAESESEFALRQIVGSVNFPTGSDFNDFLYGWLNYQIEHHLWPGLSLRQYQRAQPEVKALCARFGIPYRQQSVWRRFGQLAHTAVGAAPAWHLPRVIAAG